MGVEKIHIYTIYTDSHKPLFDRWFLPSIQDKCVIHVFHLPQECPSAIFKGHGWKKTTTRKVKIIIEAIKRHKGNWFIYSDVDIQFFHPIGDDIKMMLNEYDLVIQRNSPKEVVCSGFFACRATDSMQLLWERVLDYMNTTHHSDQGALNYVLRNLLADLDIQWKFLPETYFSAGLFTGKQWYPNLLLKIPSNIKLHHANSTKGIKNKIKQLALVWKMVKRMKQ